MLTGDETTTSTTIAPIPGLPVWHPPHHSTLGWVAILTPILLAVAGVVWLTQRDKIRAAGKVRPPRWEHIAGFGTIRGPRWAKWRIRRAFRPLVDLTDLRGADDLHRVAARWTRRQERVIRRRWKDVHQALGWDAVFDSYTVSRTGRTLVARSEIDPTERHIARVLAELGVTAHASRITVERIDEIHNLVAVEIGDAHGDPIEHQITTVDRWWYDTSRNEVGETVDPGAGRWVERTIPVRLVTGVRWISLYDLDVTWDEIGSEWEDVTPSRNPSPAVVASPIRRDGGDAKRVPPLRESGDNTVLRLHPRQIELLRVLRTGPCRVSEVVTLTGVTWNTSKQSLIRLERRRLAERDGELWRITEAGAALLSAPAAVVPSRWDAPSGDPLTTSMETPV